MFARFQIDDVVDTGGQQLVGGRALSGERFSDEFRLVRLQGHGMSSVPVKGAIGLAIFPFGDRRRGYLVGIESSGLRPKGQPQGANVLYGANGEIISLIQNKIRIVAADIEIEGKVRIAGAELMHNGKNIGHDHKHEDVMPGSALTGVPA